MLSKFNTRYMRHTDRHIDRGASVFDPPLSHMEDTLTLGITDTWLCEIMLLGSSSVFSYFKTIIYVKPNTQHMKI